MRWRIPGTGWIGRARLLLICPPFLLAALLLAQDSGQICVQSFEDRDADGLRAPGEAPVGHGISASLNDAAGVTIASLLLEDSAMAAEGLLCFDNVPAGDYQISLRSNEFFSTTAASFSASVSPGAPPPLLEFGVQPLPQTEPSRSPAQNAAAANAVLPVLVACLIMIVFTGVIGLLACLVVFRRRAKQADAPSYPATLSDAPAITGIPPAPANTTPTVDPLRKHSPGAGSPPLFADEETDAPKAN